MIGVVSRDLKAFVQVQVRGLYSEQVELAVDTGFNGSLSLLLAIVQRLQLQQINFYPVLLADGSEVELPTYQAEVLWDGEWREIEVIGSSGEALLGMALMENCELHIEVRDGGKISLEKLK